MENSMTHIEQLRSAIFTTEEGSDLAKDIIQLMERNYPCEVSGIFRGVSNVVLGDIAKATGATLHKPTPTSPYYWLLLNANNVYVSINGRVMTVKFDEE
jgi:hypothetical protein